MRSRAMLGETIQTFRPRIRATAPVQENQAQGFQAGLNSLRSGTQTNSDSQITSELLSPQSTDQTSGASERTLK